MKIIFIRGLPGTGKTIVAEILKKIFDSEIICVDKFKLQAMKKRKGFEKSNEIAHEKTLKKLQSLYEKNKRCVIVEELNGVFVSVTVTVIVSVRVSLTVGVNVTVIVSVIVGVIVSVAKTAPLIRINIKIM